MALTLRDAGAAEAHDTALALAGNAARRRYLAERRVALAVETSAPAGTRRPECC